MSFDNINPDEINLNKYTQTNETDDVSSDSSDESFYDNLPENEREDLITSIYDLITEYLSEDNVLKMAKTDFHTEIVDDITHILFQQLNDANICNEYESLYNFVYFQCTEWFETGGNYNYPSRHLAHYLYNAYCNEYRLDEDFVKQYVSDKIAILQQKDINNPEQRSLEWYKRRYQMMTASNIWQTLSTECQINRFIYDKCKPLETEIIESKWVHTEGSLHWGVKYEPLTVMVYEKMTGAKVGFLSCIEHPNYSFLGASPDGIVINDDSPLYGRLVEIKNIFNREMDGVPSEAYWIQIQVQLACCDLEVCDFVETRFKEYESETGFLEEADKERVRGVILHFVPRDGKSNIPLYKYKILDEEEEDLNYWIEQTKLDVSENHVLYRPIYWYLDDIQMTIVLRNQAWFNTALPRFQSVWETIQAERITGFQHRAPKKKAATEIIVLKDHETNLS